MHFNLVYYALKLMNASIMSPIYMG